jgi:hypothetical protein
MRRVERHEFKSRGKRQEGPQVPDDKAQPSESAARKMHADCASEGSSVPLPWPRKSVWAALAGGLVWPA